MPAQLGAVTAPPPPPKPLGVTFHRGPGPHAALAPAPVAPQRLHIGLQVVPLVPQMVALLPQPIPLHLYRPLLLLGPDKALVQVPQGCVCGKWSDLPKILRLLQPLRHIIHGCGGCNSKLCGASRAGVFGVGASASAAGGLPLLQVRGAGSSPAYSASTPTTSPPPPRSSSLSLPYAHGAAWQTCRGVPKPAPHCAAVWTNMSGFRC